MWWSKKKNRRNITAFKEKNKAKRSLSSSNIVYSPTTAYFFRSYKLLAMLLFDLGIMKQKKKSDKMSPSSGSDPDFILNWGLGAGGVWKVRLAGCSLSTNLSFSPGLECSSLICLHVFLSQFSFFLSCLSKNSLAASPVHSCSSVNPADPIHFTFPWQLRSSRCERTDLRAKTPIYDLICGDKVHSYIHFPNKLFLPLDGATSHMF